MIFDYFYGKESDQFSFIRIPKLLFTDKAFSDISNDAKILYALMLDRMALSRQNEWFDEENRVYIIFTIEEAAEMMSCGNEKIIKLFKELDDNTGIGLITRKRRGLGKPSIIYVRNFVVNDNSVNNGDDNNDQNQDIGKTEVLKSENPNSRDLKNGITDIGKSECINTEYNKTEMNHTYNQSSQSVCKKMPKEIQSNKLSESNNDRFTDRIKSILPANNFSYEQIQSIYNLASVISESNDENKIMKHLAFLWTRMQDYKYNRKNEYRYFLNVINNAGPIKNSPDIVQKTKINMKSKPSY
ncbi:MAG: replication initiator protein A, partial [Huintestinicola sp.]